LSTSSWAERRPSLTVLRASRRISTSFTAARPRTWIDSWQLSGISSHTFEALPPVSRCLGPRNFVAWAELYFGNVTGPDRFIRRDPGGGTYADLVHSSVELRLFAGATKCLSLEQLIRAKRAAGRPRDLEALAELEALREEASNG